MRLICTMDLDNAAFEDSPFDEIQRVFKSAVNKLATSGIMIPQTTVLIDVNGNKIGKVEIEE